MLDGMPNPSQHGSRVRTHPSRKVLIYIHDVYITDTHEYFSTADATYCTVQSNTHFFLTKFTTRTKKASNYSTSWVSGSQLG